VILIATGCGIEGQLGTSKTLHRTACWRLVNGVTMILWLKLLSDSFVKLDAGESYTHYIPNRFVFFFK